jgi:hypothetical protein
MKDTKNIRNLIISSFLTVYIYSDRAIDKSLQCMEINLWNLNLLKFLVYL